MESFHPSTTSDPPLFYTAAIGEMEPMALDREEAHHILRVLRFKAGDTLQLTDGKGRLCTGRILSVSPSQCLIEPIQTAISPPKPYRIELAIAPTKNADRIEWLVEKCTEIGIDCIHFIACRYSERSTLNMDRLQKKAISALKQSRQTWLPTLQPVVKFDTFLNKQPAGFIAAMDATTSLGNQASANSSYCVLIGPEGGFSPTETEAAQALGWKAVTLSKNRLRTETAGLVACQTLNFINR